MRIDEQLTEEEIQGSMVPNKYEIYKYMLKMKEGECASIYHEKGSYFNCIRDSWDKPAHTILQSHGAFSFAGSGIHPAEMRKYTIKELKAICSFPLDYHVTGTREQQWERLGRAVPPMLMKALASCLYKNILLNLKERAL